MPTTENGPRIEIVVDKKGNPTTQVFGAPGQSCHNVSEPFEKLFGDVLETEATAEAYEDPHELEIDVQQDDGS